jgi:hypothetical protein
MWHSHAISNVGCVNSAMLVCIGGVDSLSLKLVIHFTLDYIQSKLLISIILRRVLISDRRIVFVSEVFA